LVWVKAPTKTTHLNNQFADFGACLGLILFQLEEGHVLTQHRRLQEYAEIFRTPAANLYQAADGAMEVPILRKSLPLKKKERTVFVYSHVSLKVP